MTARFAFAVSAALIGLLGALHMLYTFVGPKMLPRDRELQQRMTEVSPVITSQTTMWKAWIGFNASHSMGALLFAAVYGYLALAEPAFLAGSRFLLGVGALMLAGYLVLGRRYWFSVPFAGIVAASIAYAIGLALLL